MARRFCVFSCFCCLYYLLKKLGSLLWYFWTTQGSLQWPSKSNDFKGWRATSLQLNSCSVWSKWREAYDFASTNLQKCSRFQGANLGKIYKFRVDVNASRCLHLMKITSVESGFCFKICKFWSIDIQVQRSTHSPGHNDRYHLAYFWHSFAPSPFSAAHLQTMSVQSYLISHWHDICFLEFT